MGEMGKKIGPSVKVVCDQARMALGSMYPPRPSIGSQRLPT